jgi:hypothetical protein
MPLPLPVTGIRGDTQSRCSWVMDVEAQLSMKITFGSVSKATACTLTGLIVEAFIAIVTIASVLNRLITLLLLRREGLNSKRSPESLSVSISVMLDVTTFSIHFRVAPRILVAELRIGTKMFLSIHFHLRTSVGRTCRGSDCFLWEQ